MNKEKYEAMKDALRDAIKLMEEDKDLPPEIYVARNALTMPDKQSIIEEDYTEWSLDQWWYLALQRALEDFPRDTELNRDVHRALNGVIPKLVETVNILLNELEN